MFVEAELAPFPLLINEPMEPWQWPRVPFEWYHAEAAMHEKIRACRISRMDGSTVEGQLMDVDPLGKTITYGCLVKRSVVRVAFSEVARLDLLAPLRAAAPPGGGLPQRISLSAHERSYRLVLCNRTIVEGRTAGCVEAKEGLYLFTPSEEGTALARTFIPSVSIGYRDIGETTLDRARRHWIVSPDELWAAAQRPRSGAVIPIGQALVQLGLVTPDQVKVALAQHDGFVLGERLIRKGLLTEADLQTAIAHKLGHLLVDLKHFPIQWAAARLLPLNVAARHRALPLMVGGNRVIVCVDRLSRLAALESIRPLSGHAIFPVLATKSEILRTLLQLSAQNPASDIQSLRAASFELTQF